MAKVRERIHQSSLENEEDAPSEAAQATSLDAAPAFSEEALALLFAARHKGELRYVAKWNKWLYFDGMQWNFDDTRKVFALARALCREAARTINSTKKAEQLASARTRAAVVALAGEDSRLVAVTEQWDADPWLLNTPGGVVDLRTGDKSEHQPEDFMTK